MKFTTYDNVDTKRIDRTKTWINVKYKQVFSFEIKYGKFYQIIKRYDSIAKSYTYYVAFTKVADEDTKKCKIDELGRTRFSIASIWDNIPDSRKDRDNQLNIEYIESIDDADIFKLDL